MSSNKLQKKIDSICCETEPKSSISINRNVLNQKIKNTQNNEINDCNFI